MKLIITQDDGKEIAKFNVPNASITLEKSVKSGSGYTRVAPDGTQYAYASPMNISAVTTYYEGIGDLERENNLSESKGEVTLYARKSRGGHRGAANPKMKDRI